MKQEREEDEEEKEETGEERGVGEEEKTAEKDMGRRRKEKWEEVKGEEQWQ